MSGSFRASNGSVSSRSLSTANTHLASRSLVVAVALIAMVGSSWSAGAQAPATELEGNYLYKTLMVRAAPGDLLPLIDMLQERLPVYAEFSDAGPFWMRHTQGDQWDLLLLFPMDSFEEYYSTSAIAARKQAYEKSGTSEEEFQAAAARLISWQEELLVWGPAAENSRPIAYHCSRPASTPIQLKSKSTRPCE